MSAPHSAMRKRSAIVSLFAVALAAGPSAPRAEDDTSAADRLFEEAAALMAKDEWQKACPKFETSWRLDPARGTLLGIAQCHEKAGELASAWERYETLRELAADADDRRREAIAEGRLAALEPRLPRLAIHLAPGVDAEAITIRQNDLEIAKDALGEARPVDPGEHTIRAEGPDTEPWSERVTIREGESKAVLIPPLEPRSPANDGAPGDAADKAERSEEGEASPDPDLRADDSDPRDLPTRYARDGNLAQRWIGYSALSGGLLSTGAGLAFTFRAIRKERRYRDKCPEDPCDLDDPDIEALRSDRDAAQTLATGFVGVGVVAITGGIVLWATAPSPDEGRAVPPGLRVAPLVAPRSLGASLRATF